MKTAKPSPLPTADLNGSMGISVGVLLLMIYYGIKIKGPAGFGKELFTAPFGNFILDRKSVV